MWLVKVLCTLVTCWTLTQGQLVSPSAIDECPRECSCQTMTFDCSNSDLTSLPGGIPSVRDVTTLDISRNKFDDVPASLHKTTPSLKRLDASHNRIRTLRKAAFRRLNLTFLSLSWNQLHHIDQDAFFNLSHLKELDLSGNRLSTLKGETFGKLAALQELVLDRNLFTEVPATALSRLISLHALGLGGNQLTSIKANVFSQLRNLVILDMKNNYIREIDEEGFAGLSALNALELEGNLLTDIPVAIGRLTSVQSMELLGVKKLTAFPDLSGTNQIRELRVYGSQLTRLPENFCHLVPGIKRMYLPSNRLRKMPILLGCTELRFVDLSYNEVQRLESGTFTSQRLLQDLILRNNFITEIPAGAFTGLSQLQIIDLRHNRIAYIDQTAFQPLVSLRRLNLNNNMFPSLPSEGLQSLTHLYSANNVHLSHFPSPHSLPSLQHVQVSYAYHCCQFRPGFLSRNFTGQEQSQFGTVEEGVSERVIFPGTGTIDLSPWRGQWDDVWPEFENLSDSLGRLGRKLLHDFKLGYPTRIDNFTEKYEDVDSLMFDQSPSWTMNGPVTCTPAPSPFMPCEDLFDWWALRCGVWVVFLLALLGNGTVVFVLIFSRSKMDVPRFLVCNLAAADFFMGLYLGFLAVVDASTLGEFRRYAIRWQMSDACQLTGFLGVFSSELSVFTLAVITLERNYAITHAMHLNKRLSLRHAAAVMTGGWAFALLMATLPLLGVSDYRRFAVCLPFQTAGAGTGYLVFLMLANGSAFAVLMACYCKMYCAIRGSQAWNTNDSRIARRMALLVMTDFICWAPIAFFSLAAASGVHLIGLSGAKVFTVFVLPFNSCCNPFLYAILTKQFKKDCVLICKAIEESRVTRGIGRGRHSSNFSNRHTPANTNSLAERTSKASGTQCSCQQRLLAAPGDVEQQQLATANTSKPTRWHVLRALVWCPVLKRSTKSHRANGNRQNGQVITTQFMHNTPAALASGTICQRSGEPRGHRMVSVSSDTFSGSRTDSLRQHNGCRQRADLQLPQSTNHHLHHHHHPHRHRRRRNSWSVTRRPSQESSLSTSRNDSSATAGSNATQSWQLSRSSVSSDVSGALAPVAAAASASSDTAADPSRGILKKPTLTRQTAMCDELVPLSPGCHHQPGCPLHSATCRHGASSDTVRANHSPKQVGRRKSSGGVIGSTVIPAQKVPTIIEATVEKTSPPRYRTPLLLNFPAEAENASTPAELLCLNDLTPSSWDARVEGGETSNTDTRLQLPADCQQRCRSAEHVPFPSQTTNKMVASASDTCVRDVSEKRLHDWLIDVRLANEQQLQMQQPISSEYSSTIETPGCFSSDLVVVEKHPLMEDPR